jgi:Helix-turn-helix domain
MTAAARIRPRRSQPERRVWTAAQVRALGVRTDLRTAADVLGIGERTAYEQARRGTFPVPVLRLGTKWVVPCAYLLELLGISDDTAGRTHAMRPTLAVVPDPTTAA